MPSSAYVRRRLAAVAPSDIRVEALLELWRTAQSALYGHLGLAAAAYFRYLKLQHVRGQAMAWCLGCWDFHNRLGLFLCWVP